MTLVRVYTAYTRCIQFRESANIALTYKIFLDTTGLRSLFVRIVHNYREELSILQSPYDGTLEALHSRQIVKCSVSLLT